MAHPTRRTSPPRHPDEVLPAVPEPLGRAGLVAGLGILLMAALAVLANFVVLEALVTPGDAARTARDISAAEGRFRLGIVCFLLVAVLDVVVAWALCRFFRPVSDGVSTLAAWFRMAYAAVLVVATGWLVEVLHLVDGDRPFSSGAGDQPARVLQGIDAFRDVWDAGLVLFGCHLILIAYLASRSGSVLRLIGVLLAVAGVGYLSDGLGSLLFPGYPGEIASFIFVGEFLLGVWLVVRGSRAGSGRGTATSSTNPRTAVHVSV